MPEPFRVDMRLGSTAVSSMTVGRSKSAERTEARFVEEVDGA